MKIKPGKSVLLIGGLGNLGYQLNLKLKQANHRVTILDLEVEINKYLYSNKKNTNEKLSETIYFKENNFFTSVPISKIIDNIPHYDAVVICVRTRESQENMLVANPFSVAAIAAMEENFRNTVVEPLTIIEKLIRSTKGGLSKGALIFIYSSNANQISHQSMGYHVVNSAIQNLAHYLSVSLRTNGIAVYAIELGVIDFENDLSEKKQSSATFPGATPSEIAEILHFILTNNPISLVGKSVSMTGGRALLDATAVSEQVFGDLKVRVMKPV